MAIMNFHPLDRKVDGGCVFPWACPGGHQSFLEKMPWCQILISIRDALFEKISEPYTTNLPGWFGTKSQD